MIHEGAEAFRIAVITQDAHTVSRRRGPFFFFG